MKKNVVRDKMFELIFYNADKLYNTVSIVKYYKGLDFYNIAISTKYYSQTLKAQLKNCNYLVYNC